MDPNKEAAAHSLGFITSEAGRLLKNGSSYGLMEKAGSHRKVRFTISSRWCHPVYQKARYGVEIQSKVREESPG